MSLLLPGALAALAALLLPILIHLSRRSQSQRIDFAALAWLQARLRPRRRPVIEQWLLLLVRLLLLLALVLFLAQPVRYHPAKPAHWLAVVPGTPLQTISGLPTGEQVQRHWLTAGFPAIESPPPSTGAAGFSSLIRELDAQLPKSTAITVVLPETLGGLDAERLQLSRKIDWRIVPGRMPASKAVPPALPVLAIRSDAGTQSGEVYFRAAYSAWQSGLAPDKRQTIAVLASDDQVPAKNALWLDLRNAPLSAKARQWLEAGGSMMIGPGTSLPKTPADVLWRDELGNPVLLSQAFSRGRVLQWQRDLNRQALPLLEFGDFPERLLAVIQSSTRQPGSAFAQNLQPLHGALQAPVAPQPLMPWLALTAVLLFALERWLASGRSTWSAA